jgi:hypothetical protein
MSMSHGRTFLAPIAGLSIVLFCMPARAGLQTVSYSAATASNAPTNYSTTLSVPAFNSTMGTLQSVEFSFSDASVFGGTIENISATTKNFTINEDVNFNATFGSQVLTDTLNGFTPYPSLGSGVIAQFGIFSMVGNSGTTTITNPSMLTAYIGTSPLDFAFSADAVVTVGGSGGNASVDISTVADAVLTITYTFTPNIVPEPSSLVMTALGGLMAAGFLRRRAARRALGA